MFCVELPFLLWVSYKGNIANFLWSAKDNQKKKVPKKEKKPHVKEW
jgi:hypothetical protein